MRIVPSEMKAVLHIFNHDEELRPKALPFVDELMNSVDWYSIFRQPFGSGHTAAIAWAYSLWRDAVEECNPFEMAFFMDAPIRRTVLQAIAIRWRLPIDGVTVLHVA